MRRNTILVVRQAHQDQEEDKRCDQDGGTVYGSHPAIAAGSSCDLSPSYYLVVRRLTRRVLLDVQSIVSELKAERDRIVQAIAALERALIDGPSSAGNPRGRSLTPAGRKRLSEAMKRRWAPRRRSSFRVAKITASAAPRKRRGGLTPAGRRKLSRLMKKRWAERRKKGVKKLVRS